MDYQEQFFKENIEVIQVTHAKEEDFEMLQQRERERMMSSANPSNIEEEYSRRADVIAKSIQLQEKAVEEFIGERDMLIKLHSDNMAAKFIQLQEKGVEEFIGEKDVLVKLHGEIMAVMRKRHQDVRKKHQDEEVALEKMFDANLTSLMMKYRPHGSEAGNE